MNDELENVFPVEEEVVNVPAPVVEPEPTPEPTVEPVVEVDNKLRIEVKKPVSVVYYVPPLSFPAKIVVEDMTGNIVSAKGLYSLGTVDLLTPPEGEYKLSISNKEKTISINFTVE